MRVVAPASVFPPRNLDRDLIPASVLRILLIRFHVSVKSPTIAHYCEYRNCQYDMRARKLVASSEPVEGGTAPVTRSGGRSAGIL